MGDAPRSLRSSAASASVPPVEIMSSTMTAGLPQTSPTISSASVTSWSGMPLRDDRQRPPGPPSQLFGASDAARVRADDGEVRRPWRLIWRADWRGAQVVDRNIEEPLDGRRVQIHGQDAVGAGRSGDWRPAWPRLARDLSFSSCLAYAKYGMTAVIRAAEARCRASMIRSSSIR